MMKAVLVFAMALAVAAALAGCGRSGEKPARQEGARSGGASVSDAAASRGVATGEPEEAEPGGPRAVLSGIAYEWTVSPDRGLTVTLEFTNPASDVGRAKGYAFVMAGSSSDAAVAGIYPWNAKVENGMPSDHTVGGRLLFWEKSTLSAFLPYKERAGCYNTVRVLVYDDDGRIVHDETHELPITGEPTGRKRIEQTLIL